MANESGSTTWTLPGPLPGPLSGHYLDTKQNLALLGPLLGRLLYPPLLWHYFGTTLTLRCMITDGKQTKKLLPSVY
jgi:hypothetical protein